MTDVHISFKLFIGETIKMIASTNDQDGSVLEARQDNEA
jgi:hypothetical protein